jgi:hypothetical protein
VQVMEGDSLPPPPKCSHEPLRRPRSRRTQDVNLVAFSGAILITLGVL